MIIRFANIELANLTDAMAFGVQVNGESAFEAVDIVRASKKRFFARGNQSVSLSFSVQRFFATVREAQVYLLTQFSLLPKSGACEIVCGVAGESEQTVTIAGAVLSASPQGSFTGSAITLQYNITGPEATTDTPPQFITGADAMILRDSTPIPNGAETVSVVFDTPFDGKPVVTCSVAKPGAGAANIWATVRDDLTDANGFTAELSGPAPATGYMLKWTALA